MRLSFESWWRAWRVRRPGVKTPPHPPRRPTLEELEIRAVPSAGGGHTNTTPAPDAPQAAAQGSHQPAPATPPGAAAQSGGGSAAQQHAPPPGQGGNSQGGNAQGNGGQQGGNAGKQGPPPGPAPQAPPGQGNQNQGDNGPGNGKNKGDVGQPVPPGKGNDNQGDNGGPGKNKGDGGPDGEGLQGSQLDRGHHGRGGEDQQGGGQDGGSPGGGGGPGAAVGPAPFGFQPTAGPENAPGEAVPALPEDQSTPAAGLGNNGEATTVAVARVANSPTTGNIKGESAAREAALIQGRQEPDKPKEAADADHPAEPLAQAAGKRAESPDEAAAGFQGALAAGMDAARIQAVNRLFAIPSLRELGGARVEALNRLFSVPAAAVQSAQQRNAQGEPRPVIAAGSMAPREDGAESHTVRRVLAGTAIVAALAAAPIYDTLRRLREGTDAG